MVASRGLLAQGKFLTANFSFLISNRFVMQHKDEFYLFAIPLHNYTKKQQLGIIVAGIFVVFLSFFLIHVSTASIICLKIST